MSKKIILSLFGLSLVVIACDLVNRKETHPRKEGANVEDRNADSSSPLNLSGSHSNFENKKPTRPGTNFSQKPSSQITHYDTVGLDNKVRADAMRLNKEPTNHRMLLRTDPDGTKIYRTIGMHIIASPNSEEVFLPDEI